MSSFSLTEALLRTLGRHSSQGYLLKVLHDAGLDDSTLLRTAHDRPYPVAWPAHGLNLMLQCLDPQASADACSWGLHSLTLDADCWQGAWLKGLDPATATPEELIHLLSPDKAEALCTADMACLTVPGIDGQTWSVVGLFDVRSKKLKSLTFTRTGEWIGASVLPPWPVVEVASQNSL
jgi:hypothetical protein